jgi:murE/murF fusion protein
MTEPTQIIPPGAGATLHALLERSEYSVVRSGVASCYDIVIASVCCDSRAVQTDSLFIAVPGTLTDGHRFVMMAAEQGCAAVIVERGADWAVPADWQGCVIEVQDSRLAYARIAENYYGHPAAQVKLVGITGTNGKTTITYLLEDVLAHCGYRVGVIGTVNYRYHGNQGKVVYPSPFTTPEPMLLQALLFEMVNAGVEYVIMEVSSHALAQHRIGALHFDVAAFTNLTRDHLDYHQTMDQYFQAKKILFLQHLKSDGRVVISTPQQPGDSTDWAGKLAEICEQEQLTSITCGPQAEAFFRILDYSSTLTETRLQLQVGGENIILTTPLVGHFNVDNLVTAIGVASGLGLDIQKIVETVSNSNGAPGRLQRIMVDDCSSYERPVVFVDYAHTPDALKQVLATVSALPHRELYCVFGCGGNRDNGKRPVMGSFAGGFADVAIVTDDNPRSENPDEIRRQIVPGVEKAGLERKNIDWLQSRKTGERGFVEMSSRKEAIAATVRAAGAGDIVLIAGKGHEKYQLGQYGKKFFDDCLEAETALLDWNAKAVALATAGNLVNESGIVRVLGKVSTDSRTIEAGDIFVALKGEKFDAHAFLDSVKDKGAGCLVVEAGHKNGFPSEVTRVEVADTLQALGDLARFRRCLLARYEKQFIIGITGSCGKTTVKEMTAAILRHKWPAGPDYPENAVLQTRGNLNNLIGLPLSLLPITPHTRAAVLEMGMNASGEIRAMTKVAEPDICCITNVHPVHLEGLHTIEGVASAKEEMFAEASADAVLVINLDDAHVREMAGRYAQSKICYSASVQNVPENADIFVSEVTAANGLITFMLHRGKDKVQIQLYTVGLHNIANALCAAAIATGTGASLNEIAEGLAAFRPADRRMVQMRTGLGVGVLNDTYNANPASMAAGLKTLMQMGVGRTAALLGDMLELGEQSAAAHRELGALAASLGVTYLGVVGKFCTEVFEGACSGGMIPDNVRTFVDKDNAAEWIEKLQDSGQLVEGDWLLVKASRGLQMETIVARLTGNS